MRSEKTRAGYVKQPARALGKLAAEYLEATASTLGGLEGQHRSNLSKGLENRVNHYGTSIPRNDGKRLMEAKLKDITNLENNLEFWNTDQSANSNCCTSSKCKRNVELLLKSTAIIEQLQDYWASRTTQVVKPKLTKQAAVQTDSERPFVPNVASKLEFCWTSPSRMENSNRSNEPISILPLKADAQTQTATLLLSESHQSTSINKENLLEALKKESKNQLTIMKNSLKLAEASKKELEVKIMALERKVKHISNFRMSCWLSHSSI